MLHEVCAAPAGSYICQVNTYENEGDNRKSDIFVFANVHDMLALTEKLSLLTWVGVNNLVIEHKGIEFRTEDEVLDTFPELVEYLDWDDQGQPRTLQSYATFWKDYSQVLRMF